MCLMNFCIICTTRIAGIYMPCSLLVWLAGIFDALEGNFMDQSP